MKNLKLIYAALAFFLLTGCPATDPPEQSGICGTIAGLTCSGNDYCDYGVGNCRQPDAQGECKPKPEMCTRDYRPVCGCDDKTYGNACTAAAAGVSILHDGECK